MESESTNRKIVTDNDSDEGPSDPHSRMHVDHYKFYKPDLEEQEKVALSLEEVRQYRAYDAAVMEITLRTLGEVVEELHRAYADIRLPEHECDVADWPAVMKPIGVIDNTCDDLSSTFSDEFLPHLEALWQLAHLRCRELAVLETADTIDSVAPLES